MPYVMKRNEPDLNLKMGQTLKFDKKSLPSALKFSAEWKDDLSSIDSEPATGLTQADLDAAYEKGKLESSAQGEFVVNEGVVKKFLTDNIEKTGENVRSDAKLSTLAKKYEDLGKE